MLFLTTSAALVGLVHSLAPGHWLPVVLMAKGRRWPLRTAIFGAVIAASGHIVISNALGVMSIAIGAHFLADYEHEIERYAGLMLVLFGVGYAAYSYFRHARCDGHTHHGPHPPKKNGPFIFLFSLGFSPCIAVLPVFVAASAKGYVMTMASMIAFSLGVLAALIGATLLALVGLMKLDHPIFEHYGDVLTGVGIAVMGIILFIIPI